MKLEQIKTTSTSKNTQVKVSDDLFDKPNSQLLAQAIRVYLSNKRQGTSKTKTRSEVKMTTRKWYAQKGTGNARHGAQDAALFVGGGIAHGPTGRENWKKSLSKQQKKQSLTAALTAQSSNIFINDEVEDLKGKTKEAVQLLEKIAKKFNDDKFELSESKLLIVVKEKQEKMMRSLKNIPNVTAVSANQLNALALAKAHKILMTTQALKILEERIKA